MFITSCRIRTKWARSLCLSARFTTFYHTLCVLSSDWMILLSLCSQSSCLHRLLLLLSGRSHGVSWRSHGDVRDTHAFTG